MDGPELKRRSRLETGGTLFEPNSLADQATQDQFLDTEGRILAERDAFVRTNFAAIMAATGTDTQSDRPHSPKIRLGGGNPLTPNKLYAQLFYAFNSFDEGDNTKPVINIKFTAENEGERHDLGTEHYNVSCPTDFAAYARDRVEASQTAAEVFFTPYEVLLATVNRTEPVIKEAEDTVRYLWDALRDPALNPDFAEAAEAWHSEYTD